MELDARLTMSGDLRAPGAARRFVARSLTPLLGREDVETAMLVTSELVTNAVLHAGARCELVLVGGPDNLHIRVSDATPPGRGGDVRGELTNGRGLRLLEVLCRRWGVERSDAATTVWCDLRVRG